VLSVKGLARPQGRAIARQKSAEGIVVGGNEPGLPENGRRIPGGLTPAKARTVPTRKDVGK